MKTLENDGIASIACGKSHSAFTTDNGDLFVMGSNDSG